MWWEAFDFSSVKVPWKEMNNIRVKRMANRLCNARCKVPKNHKATTFFIMFQDYNICYFQSRKRIINKNKQKHINYLLDTVYIVVQKNNASTSYLILYVSLQETLSVI